MPTATLTQLLADGESKSQGAVGLVERRRTRRPLETAIRSSELTGWREKLCRLLR